MRTIRNIWAVLIFCGSYICSYAQTTYTWTGSTSNDWSTASNWSPAGIPNSGADNAIIPLVSGTSPEISATDIQVKNLSLSVSMSITLTGHNLSINGDLAGGTPVNTYIYGSGKVIMNGAVAQYITGGIEMNELLINNTSTVMMKDTNRSSVNINLHKGLSLQSGNFVVDTFAYLTLLSGSKDTVAWINDFGIGYTGALTVNGLVSIYRSYDTSNIVKQRQISSPLRLAQGEHLSDIWLSGGTPPYHWHGGSFLIPSTNCSEDSLGHNSYYSNAFTWHEDNVNTPGYTCVTKGWKTVGVNDTFETGRGYAAYLPSYGSFRLDGIPNTGDINIPLY